MPDDHERLEILVIDNNSSDQTPDIVRKHQKLNNKDGKPIRYIKETKQGLSHARNRGIKEADADHLVFLDDDIRATKSLVSAWLSFFSENPEALAAGGKIHVQFDDPRPSCMSNFLLPLLGYHAFANSITKYPPNKYPFGGNMGFKKTVFDSIGNFNINLGRKGNALNAGEEKELFRRLREKSCDFYYLPDALLYHRVNKERLTKIYIKKQALGLGQSMQLRLENATLPRKAKNWASEAVKFMGSFPLGLVYLFGLQPAKALMLFKFRWWIWKGYWQVSHTP